MQATPCYLNDKAGKQHITIGTMKHHSQELRDATSVSTKVPHFAKHNRNVEKIDHIFISAQR